MSKGDNLRWWQRENNLDIGITQCCILGIDPSPEVTDDDPWTLAPRYSPVDGRKFTSKSRYYLHERAFFHAIGDHRDDHIAWCLGISKAALEKLVKRAGWSYSADGPIPVYIRHASAPRAEAVSE